MDSPYIALLTNDDIPPTLTNCLMLKLYGVEYYNWEPETIWSAIKHDFGITPSKFIKDKIQAMITLLTTDKFYLEWEAFENIGEVLNGYLAHFSTITPMTARECSWAMIESRLNDDSPTDFGLDVEAYLTACYKTDGLLKYPEITRNIYNKYHIEADEYSPEEQKEKQKVITIYCTEKIKQLNKLCIEFFGKDVRKEIMNLLFDVFFL